MPRIRTYLYVPYAQKDEAKKLGALWDHNKKRFYAPSYLDKNIFIRWLTPQEQNKIDINEAKNQFKTTLESQGLICDEIIMNGQLQRCKVQGDKGHEKSGAYIGYLDQYPAGYIENFKTGTKLNWKYELEFNFQYLNSKTRTQENSQKNIERNQQREISLLLLQEKTATRLQNEFNQANLVSNDHPYLIKKQIKAREIKIDYFGNLLIPLQDINGKMWSVQRITNSGSKIIGVIKTPQEKQAKIEFSARKKGCFYTQIPINQHKEFQICEGFATAMSIQELTQKPTIMAIDAGNLINVCDELIRAYPSKSITIFADNDLKKEIQGNKNIGLESALKCQKKISTY